MTNFIFLFLTDLIDSDVLLLAFAYPNDTRQELNRKFLESVQTAQPATTIYNVMETFGQLLLIDLLHKSKT